MIFTKEFSSVIVFIIEVPLTDDFIIEIVLLIILTLANDYYLANPLPVAFFIIEAK